jgi:hypothetical protein
MPIYIMLSVCDHENLVAIYSSSYRSFSELVAYFGVCDWYETTRPIETLSPGLVGQVVMRGKKWSSILQIETEERLHILRCCIALNDGGARLTLGMTNSEELFEAESPLRPGAEDDDTIYTMTAPDISLHSYGKQENRFCIWTRTLPVKEWSETT